MPRRPRDPNRMEYPPGKDPASLKNLAMRNTGGKRKPMFRTYKRDLIVELRKLNWRGSTDIPVFDRYAKERYNYDHGKLKGCPATFREAIASSRRELGIGAASLGVKHAMPNRDPEHLAQVAKYLAAHGAWGPGPLKLALAPDPEPEQEQELDDDDCTLPPMAEGETGV